ncbi:pentapeptide repeat-containing protein [Luteipulveratus mongoliensis]|uniref:Membrane-associated oxidoreductase n=1 Tax=Luteipulveratus mongoliensis TaxID=571913 RepID=A0A0K1JE20_9MICO|nr:pentapeptide repeat-containing protein [Luteipulveratus mongoliensis]AKU14838.1 hypothetical protein VV02_01415 [Luteipulveratus mongoliensis]
MTGDIEDWDQRIRAALEVGDVIDLAPEVEDEDLSPEDSSSWRGDRTIPAAALLSALVSTGGRAADLRIRGARIEGQLDLDDVPALGELSLVQCDVREKVLGSGASIRRLDLRGSRLAGITLVGANIAQQISAQGAVFTGELQLSEIQVGGPVELSDVRLTNPGATTLCLDGARISGPVTAVGLISTGVVTAVRAHLAGRFDLTEAQLTNPKGDSLKLDGAVVTGALIARRMLARGEVRARGVELGHLSLAGARLSKPHERASTTPDGQWSKLHALTLDNAVIRGGVIAEDMTASGEVRARLAEIDGDVVFKNARLSEHDGDALTLDGLRLSGYLFATGLTVKGTVRAKRAKIKGPMDLTGVHLSRANGDALQLYRAEIAALLLDRRPDIEGRISLRRAEIGDLIVSKTGEEDAELTKARLDAIGWELKDLDGPLRSDRDAVARWLDTAPTPEGGDRFASQPWHEVASVYDRAGASVDANWLRYQAAVRDTRYNTKWYAKPYEWGYRWLVGYGYHPFWPMIPLALVIILSCGICATNHRAFVMADPLGYADVTGDTTHHGEPITGSTPCKEIAADYPCFDPVPYALTTVTPIGALQSPMWAPSSENYQWISWGLVVLKAFGWMLSGLLLAGVTGLLKKT